METIDIKELGLKIGKYLKDHGMKQTFLVEKTGLTAHTISDICTGTRKTIDIIEFYKICKALDLNMMEFIENGVAA